MRRILLACCLLVAGALTGCTAGADGAEPDGVAAFTRAGFESEGRTWPLTADEAELRCYGSELVTATVEDVEYQLNDEALHAGFPRIDPVWATDPESELGLRINITDLRSTGRGLCSRPR